MDLDSPSSSPAMSPVIPPVPPSPHRLQTKSASFSPPGLWISTSPQQPAVVADRQITPLHLSPDNGDPPGLSMLPPSQQSRDVPPATPVDTEVKQIEKIGTPGSTLSDTSHTIVASPPLKQSITTEEHSQPTTPTPEPTAAAAPYVPKRKIVPNPFVSGGLLTDFVGTSSTLKGAEVSGSQDTSESSRQTVRLLDSYRLFDGVRKVIFIVQRVSTTSLSPPPGSSSPPPGLNSSVRDKSADIAKDIHSTTIPAPATQTSARPKTPSISQSSASSSKVKVEDVPSPTSDTPAPSLPPPTPPLVSSLMNMFVPASNNRTTTTTQPPAPTPETRRQWTRFGKSNTTPPPDARELAHVPTPSYSNPLGIRPSNFGWGPNRPPLPNPPPLPPQAPPPRKPVAIGAGWPYNRQANGNHGRRGSYKRGQHGPAAVPPFPPPYFTNGNMPSGGPMSGSDAAADARPATDHTTENSKSPSGTYEILSLAQHLYSLHIVLSLTLSICQVRGTRRTAALSLHAQRT